MDTNRRRIRRIWTYEDWALTGVAAIIKHLDSSDDGYLDTIAIKETLG